MTTQVLYTVKGTKIEDLDLFKNKNFKIQKGKVSENDIQTVKYWSKDNPEKVHTVDIKFLKPTSKIEVSKYSSFHVNYKTLDNGEIAKKLAELKKANPGKKYNVNVWVADLTKGNGEIYYEEASSDEFTPPVLKLKESNAQTIAQLENMKGCTAPPSFYPAKKAGATNHLLYQYKIYDNDGKISGYEHVSQPLIAEVKTVGSLSGF